jgi:phage major head subunit gpT-like protein
MATVRSNFDRLLEPGLREIYFKKYTMEPMRYTQVFNVMGSQRATEDVLQVAGLGTLATKPEGTPISYKDPVQGMRQRVVHSTFALGFRVTMEMMQDDLYNIINKMPADLGDATRHHQETLAWGVLNDAFDGNTHTVFDGSGTALSLCNTAHTSVHAEGVNQSNQANPGVALGVTALEAAMTNLRLTRSEEGRYTPIDPSVLLIHPDLDHEAHRLLDSEFEPGTSENQVNSMRSSRTGVSPMSVPYLTDTDAWFLLASKSQHSLKYYKRMPVTFSRGTDSQTKDALFDAMYRASVTVDDWRGVYGSQP